MRRSTVSRTFFGIRLGVIVVATFACLYQLVLVKMAESARIDRSISAAAREIDTNLQALNSARRLLEIEESNHKQWEARVLASIPSRPHVNDILEQLGEEVEAEGMKLINSYASDEIEIESGEKSAKEKYFQLPIEVELTGNLEQIAAFLDRLNDLPRMTRLAAVNLSRKSEFFPVSHGEIRLDVFYRVEQSAGSSALPEKR